MNPYVCWKKRVLDHSSFRILKCRLDETEVP